MAFLCSGYWALLFCFASVQIAARGAAAAADAGNAEGEVALMQTTVESAKLRMAQIAELAKKPNVHKSKQHLEKMTKDAETMASHALALAKSQSGNITETGITDPLTIAALNTMNDEAQRILDQAVKETVILRNLLNLAYNDAQACEVQVETFPGSYESEHVACRTDLKTLYERFRAARDSYEAAVGQVRSTSGCVTQFVSDCPPSDAEFFALSNYANLESCLYEIDSWAENGYDEISSKSTDYRAFLAKQPECDALQQEYEHAFRVHRLSKVTQCQENLHCYESNKATHDQQAELVVSTNDARRASYAAGTKIQCLVDKLLTDLSETAIASCDNVEVDTIFLEITPETLPPDPAWSCPLTVEELDAQGDSRPCTTEWRTDYEAKDWYLEEYPLRCMSSCSVLPDPRLWMEAPQSLSTPGALISTEGGVWTLITWASTEPAAPPYSFGLAGQGGDNPRVVTDDGSCRKIVKLRGGRGFQNLVYKPNINDYLELWVVSDGDVVAGEDGAFILDSGNFPSNGFGFMYSNNNKVEAYAANQKAVADRPAAAASGLNVWRVQWKSGSYIAISFNNKLLVKETVSVSLTVDYSALPGGSIRLGLQSKSNDRPLQGHIAELQLFDRELTDYEANVTNLGFLTKFAVNGTKGGICT